MATLHTVNKSPTTHSCLKECLRLLSGQDALLLLEDGAYGADGVFSTLFENTAAELYVLKADVEARGLSTRLSPRFTLVDDHQFVELVVRFDNSQSWY